MSHPAQLDFVKSVKDKFPANFNTVSVIEIGSLNINGTVRIFFDYCNYIGVDVGEGRDVDVVCPAHELSYLDNVFDTAISCECFEHDKYWVRSFGKMHAMVKPKGLVIFSCATTGRPEHGTTATTPNDAPFTTDYYRNLTEEDFRASFDLDSMFSQYEFSVHDGNHDLYFWGVKK
jgi:SAM-dependent methyltransferase